MSDPFVFKRRPLLLLPLLILGCLAGHSADPLERSLSRITAPAKLGARRISRLAIAPLRREYTRAGDELELLRRWGRRVERSRLVERAIVLRPQVFQSCALDDVECEFREAARAARTARADALVFARMRFSGSGGYLGVVGRPGLPEVITSGALVALEAENESVIRYERASVTLSAEPGAVAADRKESIQGFLAALSDALLENAAEYRRNADADAPAPRSRSPEREVEVEPLPSDAPDED